MSSVQKTKLNIREIIKGGESVVFARTMAKLILSLLPFLVVVISAEFIDLAVAGEMRKAMLTAGILALTILMQRLGGNLDTWLRIIQRRRLFPRLDQLIVKKIIRLSYSCIEDSEIQDVLNRVSKDPEEMLNGVFMGYLSLGSFIISNVSLLFLLVTQAPHWISPVILILLVFFCRFAIKSGEKQYTAQKEVTETKRMAAYTEKILSDRETANERILFGFAPVMNQRFARERKQARLWERKARRWWFIGMNMGGFLAIGLSVLVIFALIFPVVQGNTSVGLFISLVTAFMSMAQSLTWQLPQILKEMEQGKRLLADYFFVLKLPEYEEDDKTTKEPLFEFETLEFVHVSFHYPKTERMILKDMNFRMEKGKHYAFVGRNGCGKSTVVKLILRLYEPDSGQILLNGRPIEHFERAQLWQLFAALFQDHARYPITILENIALGRASQEETQEERKEVLEAAHLAGLSRVLEKLPNGADTLLGKITEESVDLSGGEWQRIAMARLYYGRAQVKILDEPTAAIDPVQEQRIYQKFLQLYQKMTTIMITHRLGATSLCDWIFVIDDGRIAEQGSHGEMMDAQGIYSMMYEKQRGWYL